MQKQTFNNEFNKMFKWFTNESTTPGLLKLELDLYKELLNFFLIGNSYYFVLNHHNLECDFVSKEVEDVIGYNQNEFTIFLMNDITHPGDLPWFLSIGKTIQEFFLQLPVEKIKHYKVRYDYRLRKKNGEYVRILYQGIMIEQDESGKLLRTLNLHTDITYLKKEGKPILSFIGLENEPSYLDVDLQNSFSASKEDFTVREKQVLKLLIEGKLSKQISSILNISKQTVDTHRKNMLHKKNLSNTNELVSKAITNGWI